MTESDKKEKRRQQKKNSVKRMSTKAELEQQEKFIRVHGDFDFGSSNQSCMCAHNMEEPDLDLGSPSWNDVSNQHFENEDMEEVEKEKEAQKEGECDSDIDSDSEDGDWSRTDWSSNTSTPPLRRGI